MRQHGFTLLELLATLAVAAILAAVAVPGTQRLLAEQRLSADHNALLAGLYLARSEAITHREPTVFTLTLGAPWAYDVHHQGAQDAPLRQRRGADARLAASHRGTTSGALRVTFDRLGRLAAGGDCAGGCTIMLRHTALGDAAADGECTDAHTQCITISGFGRIGRGGAP